MQKVDVANILNDLGIVVRSETDTHYIVLCPVHRNTQTSSATISKSDGFLWCFNPACGTKITLTQLLRRLRGWDIGRSLRYIENHSSEDIGIDKVIKEIYASKDELPSYPEEEVLALQEAFWKSNKAQRYMAWRGFNQYTVREFGIGYEKEFDRICTPMYDTSGNPVGLIRRSCSLSEKEFKNTPNLPTKLTLFNIHRAKRSGASSLILTESNFDAIRIHQAGYPNVCATLGGTFSDYHVTQVYRSFDSVILMTDDDEPGRKFAKRIARRCQDYGLGVYRGQYDEYNLFPNGAKDVCDQDEHGNPLLTDQDIIKCITNASVVF